AAVYALDRIGDTRAAAFVIECLEDPDPYVRWSAAVALRRLWTPDCAAALRKAAADPEETVATAARDTLSLVLQ
ncbi:MAG TPA: HEAT repeat domain-containing protein, partial [Planctomycetota bacterium]|nr:HEAT repeat domain-containing protein [Planctomycetota bacterium]